MKDVTNGNVQNAGLVRTRDLDGWQEIDLLKGQFKRSKKPISLRFQRKILSSKYFMIKNSPDPSHFIFETVSETGMNEHEHV